MSRLTPESELVAEGESPQKTAAPTIALWGAAGSGKSGIVGALRGEADKSVGERWAIDIRRADRSVMDVADRAFLALRLRGVKDTAVIRPESPLLIPLRRFEGKKAQDVLSLDMVDAQGRWCRATDVSSAAFARPIVDRVTSSAGIIWLVETPAAGQGRIDPAFLLPQLTALLQATGEPHLRVPVALCLTKIDRLSANEMQKAIANPASALRSQLGAAAFGQFEMSCPQLRCFALSAAGTVRNAVRPIGLAPMFDWFGEQHRLSARRAQAEQHRARRSAGIARVRRVLPRALAGTVAVGLLSVSAMWAATHVRLRDRTWFTSSGSVASPPPVSGRSDAQPVLPAVGTTNIAAPAHRPELVRAADEYQRGDARGALATLAPLELASDAPDRSSVDSLLALVALRSTEEVLTSRTMSPADVGDVLHVVVSATSAAIRRTPPGSFGLAPLYLARAVACIGGRLGCPNPQIREDLAWVLLLGTPEQQDEARRMRAAWLGDQNASAP